MAYIGIGEVSWCFSRSSLKFQGHMGQFAHRHGLFQDMDLLAGGGTWRSTRPWRRSVGVSKSGAASRSRKCMAMPVKLPGLHTTLLRSMQSGSSGLQSRTRLRLYMPTLITRALRSTAWQSRCDVRTRTSVVKCLSGTTRVNFALMTRRGWRPG